MSVLHAKTSGKAAPLDTTKVGGPDWDAAHVFSGGALGSLLFRDTGASDGASWLAAVASGSVLVSAGVATAPAWSATPSLTSLTLGTPLAAGSGGTGSAYFSVSGLTASRTFTFPDASATVLTSNAAVTAAQGGTGLSSFTTGDLLYASGAAAIGKLADVAAGSYLRSGGVGAAPVWSTLTLPNAATAGDLVIASSANVLGSLADVATGSVLVSGGVGTAPAWSATPTLTSLTLTTLTLGTSGILQGGTNLVEQRNGTNAQTWRLYNTFTSASNCEYLRAQWSANVFILSTDFVSGSARQFKVGTEGANSFTIRTNATDRWNFDFNGHMLANADNSYDIGASAANRPRNAYLAGLLTLSGGTLLATSAALTNGAAAQTGTLTNAPAAGNPTKWIPINDNGTTRYIPAW